MGVKREGGVRTFWDDRRGWGRMGKGRMIGREWDDNEGFLLIFILNLNCSNSFK